MKISCCTAVKAKSVSIRKSLTKWIASRFARCWLYQQNTTERETDETQHVRVAAAGAGASSDAGDARAARAR